MHNYGLLRGAIYSRVTKFIDFLAGPRPTVLRHSHNYGEKFTTTSHSIENPVAILPDLLGWQPDELDESSPLLPFCETGYCIGHSSAKWNSEKQNKVTD